MFSMLSVGPSIQVEKPGDASSELNLSASFCLSLELMKESTSMTPTLSKGGFCR